MQTPSGASQGTSKHMAPMRVRGASRSSGKVAANRVTLPGKTRVFMQLSGPTGRWLTVSSLANPAGGATVSAAMKLPRLLVLMSLFSLLAGFVRGEALKVGDKAPTVTAMTDAGTNLNLADVYKKNNYTLVWFYPKALTGGCTKQGCSLRDASAELKQKGVAVVGVSTDPVEKQKEFKDVNNFPFPLLADTDKKVIKAFGQTGVKPVASREAYLVDRNGKIVYHDEGQTEKQAEKVLEFLKTQKS
jgi:thioredoxin-dependent peroxiredoxin